MLPVIEMPPMPYCITMHLLKGQTCCSGVRSALCRCTSILCQGILENFLFDPFHRSLWTSCT